MPDEYISRARALADFEACNAENPRWTPQRVKTLLLRQPVADVAEVVRCKDCINTVWLNLKKGYARVRNTIGKRLGINCPSAILTFRGYVPINAGNAAKSSQEMRIRG